VEDGRRRARQRLAASETLRHAMRAWENVRGMRWLWHYRCGWCTQLTAAFTQVLHDLREPSSPCLTNWRMRSVNLKYSKEKDAGAGSSLHCAFWQAI